MPITILQSRNQAWGFFGTIERAGEGMVADPTEAWQLAFEAIAATTGAAPAGIRDFLDSRHGRHFADDVASELRRGTTLTSSIEAATARWMGWRIDRRTSRETGIPAGLPYLTGFATHFEILARADA